MPVRSLNHGTAKPRQRRELWDGLTIGLAIAIVFVGLLILLMPKSPSRAETAPKSKEVPANMALITPFRAGTVLPA